MRASRRLTARASGGEEAGGSGRGAPRLRGALPRVLCALLLASGATAAGARAASSPAGATSGSGSGPGASGAVAADVAARVIPVPAAVQAGGGAFRITSGTPIEVDSGPDAPGAGSPQARSVADYAAALLRPSTGYPLPVEQSGTAAGDGSGDTEPAGIVLALGSTDEGLGDEGYRLRTTAQAVTVSARTPAGLFHGVQTLRQLLPAAVENRGTVSGVEWTVPDTDIRDVPRYAYRGAMLDAARHFLTVAQVERAIDQYALYKINTLHLHLTDDQGWRIAVNSWPRLTTYGGSTQVGGGPGGWYSQDDYKEIVRYAASRFLTVVPEIDGPGHSNAALASYAELNCDGKAPALYTGTAVGFSTFCAPKEITYTFLDDVVREIAALTPGPYVHIGGDEAQSTSAADYATYTDRAQQVVAAHGKTAIGWHQIDSAHPAPGTLAQYWGTAGNEADVAKAAQAGTGLIMSPANRAYLDMQYDASTPVGKHWAGYVDVRTSYGWDPATFVQGVPAAAVRGVEAALWTETLQANKDMDYMTFPRLPGIAEIGWSPAATHDWNAYRVRLAAQGPRWTAMGIAYYRSPQVDWPAS